MRSRLIAAVICLALSASTLHADEALVPPLTLVPAPLAPESRDAGPEVAWGLVGGALTALVPLAIGSLVFAESEDPNHRKAATLTIGYGMALAPIVSHLVVREWTRAAIFGAVPLACAVGLTALLEVQPTATSFGTRGGRWAYGLLMTFDVISAGFGVIDTLGARLRRDDRVDAARRLARIPVLPTPIVLPGGGGLAAVGAF